jgi:hypothetical protein
VPAGVRSSKLTAVRVREPEASYDVLGLRPRIIADANRAIDLRTLDRHPLASLGAVAFGLKCSWCPGSAPMPKLLGLYALSPARRQDVAL